MESAAGELLQRLPPRLARDWIWMPPISEAESISAGKRWRRLVGVDARARRRRADAERAVGGEVELRRLREVLDVDHDARPRVLRVPG